MTYKKIYKYFKWKPINNLDEGLAETINWYKSFLKKYSYKNFLSKELK